MECVICSRTFAEEGDADHQTIALLDGRFSQRTCFYTRRTQGPSMNDKITALQLRVDDLDRRVPQTPVINNR